MRRCNEGCVEERGGGSGGCGGRGLGVEERGARMRAGRGEVVRGTGCGREDMWWRVSKEASYFKR